MKDTLDFIAAGAAVSRYHTCDLLKPETVGHHSHGVALLCLLIDPECSLDLIKAALLHDMAEQRTGDIPSPAKRDLGIGGDLEVLEHRILAESGFHFPELSEQEKLTLKLADIAHGALKCAREVNMGNSTMRIVYDRFMMYAGQLRKNTRATVMFDTIRSMVK